MPHFVKMDQYVEQEIYTIQRSFEKIDLFITEQIIEATKAARLQTNSKSDAEQVKAACKKMDEHLSSRVDMVLQFKNLLNQYREQIAKTFEDIPKADCMQFNFEQAPSFSQLNPSRQGKRPRNWHETQQESQ